ncbi:MAG: 3-terminal-phosphate cyclase [Myxococcaceae bacterium]|nr:3-terminal-phosphate cyclase [Myxococcaceae bacterium]
MSKIRELLNRARWRDAGLHALEVHVLHRGAAGDRRVIAGSRIAAIRSAGIELVPETEEGDTIFVPYHRFLAISGPDGALWSKEARAVAEAVEVEHAVRVEPALTPGVEIVSTLEVVLHEATKESPLVIDGSAGEGGGQILRTSLALSMATGTPFVLEKIRAGRKKPGLMRQHLSCVKAAALVCGAEVEGATLGSTRIAFRPGPIAPGDHVIDIGSAGSVSLVLQTLALPLALATTASRITVRGGTHALCAPPFPFLDRAWLPLMRRAGAQLGLELVATGFYPAGGGEVVMTVSPATGPLTPLHLGEGAVLRALELRAVVAGLSEGIARRELASAAELLTDSSVTLASESVRSPGPGNAMWLVACDDGTGVSNVFSAIGDVGTSAEDVGAGVARGFLAWRASGTSIEAHLADQVMLPIALAGEGSFTCNELTLHARTNMEVIRAFTGHRLRAWDLGESRFRVALMRA